MVVAISVNTLRPGEGLYDACKRVSFKSLAWGLYGARDRITLDKSEYETATEFSDRRGKLEGIINQQGQIVICQPLDDNEDAPFRYDADREVFIGTFDQHQNVWRDVKRTGSYVSRTRMGVRATVTSSIDIEYDLQLSSLDVFARSCGKQSYGSLAYEVPIPRATAPLLKAAGYLVFVGRLVSPFVTTSDSPGEPSLDNPKDVYERDIEVHLALASAAVVGPGNVVAWKCAPAS
jgi:hypothetical protein